MRALARNNMAAEMPTMGQGPVRPLTEEELEKDNIGFTHPNLHRRMETTDTYKGEGELQPRKYTLGLYGVCSIRTTETFIHDEDSQDCETP